MSTIFTNNPIKVNLISTKNTIKQKIIFIGIVPSDVKSELLKIESSNGKNINNNNKILSKFYGSQWESKLGIKNYIISKKGGDDFSFDDDTIEVNSNDDTVEVNSNDDSSILIEDVNDTNDDLNGITIDELNDIDTIEIDDEEVKVSQITKSENNNIKFIFSEPYLSLYPEDNILDFKKKIYTVLNIPIFRQHLWYVYQNRIIPLNYSVFKNNSLKSINIQDMLNKYNDPNYKQHLIETIPINIQYYHCKNNIKITTNDTFSILDDYFHKYGITEYNLLDLNDFIDPSRKFLLTILEDRYQMELIYYSFIMIYWPMLSFSAFTYFIKSESNIPKFYPDLQEPIQALVQKFKMEKRIIDTKINLISNPSKKSTLKKIRGDISNSIISAIMSVLSYSNNKDNVIQIRNLFDKLPLNNTILSCKCLVSHNNKKIILNKTYKNNSVIKETIDMNSIMYKIKMDSDTIKTISLIFYKNGNYIIKSKWREELNYDFNDIYNIIEKLVNPIIKDINKLSTYVLINKDMLPLINKNNIKFTEIGMSMFYRKSLSDNQFDIIKSIMKDYTNAGIVKERLIEKSNSEYYFSKGMYQFDSSRIEKSVIINNYYEFLNDGNIKQKWYTIFEKTRITKIYNRSADIKIEIIGIKENEFFIFYNFIMTLFYIYNEQLKANPNKNNNKEISHESKIKKSLRNLKEQDPVLYNFKKIYKTENIYSKICQKPYQPLLLNKQGYDQLSKDKKTNAVKYWNFTSNKDAYYVCPNPKYPYIKFIIKRHPKDYCIPCCKKMEISDNIKDTKRLIYDICMKDHKYTPEERTITKQSRYIMSYGKDVEPGRISRLPEDSLEPLFYETYSLKNNGIDHECINPDGYFLYGVEQSINGIQSMGILNILIHATETDLIEFINNIIKLIKITPSKFSIILNGDINNYFTNLNDFITQLHEMFLTPNKLMEFDSNIPWNEIFINIAYLFLNINIINFKAESSGIKLIISEHISSKDNLLLPSFNNLIVMKKRDKYFPIYLLNTNVFFKSKLISNKLFNFNDDIITVIKRLMEYNANKKIKNNIMENINLNIISKFVKDGKYKINKIFVNNVNMCYYIQLKSNNNLIHIPIENSYYVESDKFDITYQMYNRKNNKTDIKTLMMFIKDFNHWIALESEKAGLSIMDADKNLPLEKRVQPIYPYIEIKNWLVLSPINKQINKSSNVIGFVSNNINYYITDIKLSKAMNINNVKLIQMFYDPDIINTQIYKKATVIFDKRCNKIGKSIYKSNLYQIVILEFMTLFNKSRNVKLRQKIKKIILSYVNTDFDEILDKISELIPDSNDYIKLKNQLCEFIKSNNSKIELLNEIDDSLYNFDREIFEKIKLLPKDKLLKELEKLSLKFVKYGDIEKIKDFEFPNILTACQLKINKTNSYCSNNKLIIGKTQLKDILEVFASDILNPVKEKWIFSNIINDSIISFFKFIRRPDEIITIEEEE